MKIASWNVNSLNVRLPHLQQWLGGFAPDVVGLQETKLEDHKFPHEALAALGYRSVFSGQKTYNGVAILAREEPREVLVGVPGFEHEHRRAIAATVHAPGSTDPDRAVRIVNLYVVNGQDVGTDKYAYKLRWLEAVTRWIEAELQQHAHLVVMGDFNIAPDDRDVHDPEAWHEKILCSTPERDALGRLMNLGLHDTFRLFDQAEGVYSWWDYRAAMFRRGLGLRIDLVLCSDTLKASCTTSYIDKEPRRLERPSDHAPAVAEFALG